MFKTRQAENSYHWLTAEKGVHQFRYFLLMNTYCCLLMHVCIFMENIRWTNELDPMRTLSHLAVRIGSHLNKNAYMHEQTTIEFGVRIVGRENLNWCIPFFAVSH